MYGNIILPLWTRGKNWTTVFTACRRRRLKGRLSVDLLPLFLLLLLISFYPYHSHPYLFLCFLTQRGEGPLSRGEGNPSTGHLFALSSKADERYLYRQRHKMRKATENHLIIIFLVKIIMAGKNTNMALSPRQPLNGQRVLRISGLAVRVATWNARSMYAPGKLENLEMEMNRLNITILGVSDVRWTGSGTHNTKNGILYYSGGSNHIYGVGILIKKHISASVINFMPGSDRVMLLQLQAPHNKVVNIIQIYAPTADKCDNEIEKFYSDLGEMLKLCKNKDITIVMGDFNAKVGEGCVDNCVGEFGLGVRNERGDRLVQFCQDENMIITNTMFKHPKRRLYTWKSPADSNSNVVRNQIDYILIKNRYRNAITSVKTYPGADINSDHNPLVAILKVKLKRLKKSKIVLMDLQRLKDEDLKSKMATEINVKLKECQEKFNSELLPTNEKWKLMHAAIAEVANTHLKSTRKQRNSWITEEILELMNERRKFKNINIQQYKIIHKVIKNKIKIAKEKWLHEQCKVVEDCERNYDVFNLHKNIKEMTGTTKKMNYNNSLNDKNGKLISDFKLKLDRWTEYVEELFEDERSDLLNLNINQEEIGPTILREEVECALNNTKDGKTPGSDELPVELLKLIDDEMMEMLVKLFNAVYSTGVIPKDWLLSTFVLIPKKIRAKECADYRTIALMSHTLKTFLKIIHKRIYRKLEMDIAETQFGFRNGLGTREALFGINVLFQRCLDMNQDVYACFIDFEKAFDRVRHDKMKDLLKQRNIDYRDIRIICNLYWNQSARVRVDGELTGEIEIRRGVRQGCILSPLLFNLYSEELFRDALDNVNKGIIINGVTLNNLRYADDTVILADSIEDLEHMMIKLNMSCRDYGLSMNLGKTKFMVISKSPIQTASLVINNKEIDRVMRYKYLGTWLDCHGDQSGEIRTRIEMARSAFIKLKRFLCSRDIDLQLRMRMLRCYVFSILLYGLESWTLKNVNLKNIEAFEMWCYRRMNKIKWTDKVTNVTVLNTMQKQCEVTPTIKRRKLQYLGHIMRGERYSILRLIIQGKIKGRRSVGRRRTSWLKNLREWCQCTSIDLFRSVVNKIKLAMLISKFR